MCGRKLSRKFFGGKFEYPNNSDLKRNNLQRNSYIHTYTSFLNRESTEHRFNLIILHLNFYKE
jgi:hypothetical protein